MGKCRTRRQSVGALGRLHSLKSVAGASRLHDLTIAQGLAASGTMAGAN